MLSRSIARWVLRVLAASALAVGLLAGGPPAAKRLAAYGFGVTQGGTTVVVDVGAGHIRVDQRYLPVRVFIAKEDRGTLEIVRGSFTLTDPKGERHPVATVEEVRTNYGPNLIASDYEYERRQADYGYVRLKFSACRFMPSPVFFANPSGPPHTLFERGEVTLYTYTGTFLYFANPLGKDPGVYTLTYSDPARQVEISVPFTVDWIR